MDSLCRVVERRIHEKRAKHQFWRIPDLPGPEARLGIDQGSVSATDYRDSLADLIDGQFGSRLEFCRATGVDPGQLSRVFAGRADLSLKALQSVLAVLHAQLVIQTEERARELTSIDRAEEALTLHGANR